MKFGQRLRSRVWKPRVDHEVDAEFDFHIEMRARELMARGMTPSDARETAIRRFGNIDRVNAMCRAIGTSRDNDMRRTEYLSELAQDIKFACRQLLKAPGFTTVAILTLALGIGATSAIFSAVQAVVLRPLPFPAPERIFAIYESGRFSNRSDVSAGIFIDGVASVGAFSAVTAMQYSSFNLSGSSADPERTVGARVTAGFFDVYPMPPAHGRVFTNEEDQPGKERVVVLSHALWQRRFGGRTDIIGRQITLNEQAYDVLGVMPAAFTYTADAEELWVPVAFTPERKAMYDEHYLQVFGRLRPEATPEQARTALQQNAERIRKEHARHTTADLGLVAIPALEDLAGNYPRRLFTLLGAVAFVLLIACGNVANLLLARGAARQGELAVRAALGAGRARIARQLLTESAVLAIVSAGVGLALASWGIRALTAAAPRGVPRLEQASIDPVVVGFTLAVAVLCTFVFGLAPALRAAKSDVLTTLKEGGRGAGMGGVRDRLRTGLIAAELAVALVLLIGAGLLIRSSLALQRVSTGFDPAGVMTARLTLPEAQYGDRTKVVQTLERLAETVAHLPGAASAAITTQVPMSLGGNGNGLIPEGVAFDVKNAISTRLRIVTDGYFDTMKIKLIAGRGFNDSDRFGALKVMMVSEGLAKAAFPNQNPLGRRIACCEAGPDGKSPDFKTIVGVVSDVRHRGLGVAPTPEFYLPIDQAPAAAWDWNQRTVYIAVRTTMSPEAMVNPVRTALKEIAPGVPLFQIRSMEQRLAESIATERFNTLLLTVLGVIGLVLAAVGVYGVIAYFVTRRTPEIGVRMALGASRGSIVSLVFRQASMPVALGLIAGVVLSTLLTRVLSTQLFGVTPSDPLTFVVVVLVLGAVAVVAGVLPATRAASVNPATTLRAN
jgi:putative ABC transport system permease protein